MNGVNYGGKDKISQLIDGLYAIQCEIDNLKQDVQNASSNKEVQGKFNTLNGEINTLAQAIVELKQTTNAVSSRLYKEVKQDASSYTEDIKNEINIVNKNIRSVQNSIESQKGYAPVNNDSQIINFVTNSNANLEERIVRRVNEIVEASNKNNEVKFDSVALENKLIHAIDEKISKGIKEANSTLENTMNDKLGVIMDGMEKIYSVINLISAGVKQDNKVNEEMSFNINRIEGVLGNMSLTSNDSYANIMSAVQAVTTAKLVNDGKVDIGDQLVAITTQIEDSAVVSSINLDKKLAVLRDEIMDNVPKSTSGEAIDKLAKELGAIKTSIDVDMPEKIQKQVAKAIYDGSVDMETKSLLQKISNQINIELSATSDKIEKIANDMTSIKSAIMFEDAFDSDMEAQQDISSSITSMKNDMDNLSKIIDEENGEEEYNDENSSSVQDVLKGVFSIDGNFDEDEIVNSILFQDIDMSTENKYFESFEDVTSDCEELEQLDGAIIDEPVEEIQEVEELAEVDEVQGVEELVEEDISAVEEPVQEQEIEEIASEDLAIESTEAEDFELEEVVEVAEEITETLEPTEELEPVDTTEPTENANSTASEIIEDDEDGEETEIVPEAVANAGKSLREMLNSLKM